MIQEARPSSTEPSPTSPPAPPVRVGYLVSTRSYGGPERQIVGVARALDRTRFSPIIITFVCHPSEERPLLTEARKAGIPTATVHMPTTFDPRGVQRLMRVLRSNSVGLLCTRGYKADILGLMAGRLIAIPLVAVCGGWTAHTWLIRLYESADRTALRHMDHVVAVSEAMRRTLIGAGIAPKRIAVAPNAVDATIFRPGDGTRLRKELSIEKDTLVIAAAGRLSPEKGHRYLVEGFAHVRSRLPCHLLLAGDGPERPVLESLVLSLGLRTVTTFVGWHSDVREVYWAADVVCLPSLREGMPNAVLEAMACGKPVVGSDVGGVRELLADNESGILVPPGDPQALARAVTRIVEDPELAERMGKCALDRAGEMTFWRTARLIENAYASTLRNSSGSRSVLDG